MHPAVACFLQNGTGNRPVPELGSVSGGSRLYDDWDAKKSEFIRYITNSEHRDDNRLTNDQYQKPISI